MKTRILIAVLLIAAGLSIASCASSKGSGRGGCKGTQGYVGYGH